MSNFFSDLAFGKSFETYAMEMLGKECTPAPVGRFKPYDFISDKIKYEVKSDKITYKTGNLFIEYECSNLPSGILTSEAQMLFYFVINAEGNPDRIYLIETGFLKNLIASSDFKCVSGGDGYRVKGHLIPEQLLKNYLECW